MIININWHLCQTEHFRTVSLSISVLNIIKKRYIHFECMVYMYIYVWIRFINTCSYTHYRGHRPHVITLGGQSLMLEPLCWFLQHRNTYEDLYFIIWFCRIITRSVISELLKGDRMDKVKQTEDVNLIFKIYMVIACNVLYPVMLGVWLRIVKSKVDWFACYLSTRCLLVNTVACN